jgi:Zn-dependent membrane protease YugP
MRKNPCLNLLETQRNILQDIYDPQNTISLFLSERSYATTYAAAFSIYKKSTF